MAVVHCESEACSFRIPTFMKPFCIALFTVELAQFSAGADPRPSSDVEIRFCPAARVHTYPLESQRDIHSLLLQNMAVINHGSTLFKIGGIDLELLQAGQVVDSRKLDSAAAQRFAERGAKTQGAGMIEAVAFQFCGTDLIAPDVKVTGPSLEKDQALLITSQVFAFSGKRDTLRAWARGSLDGRAHEIAATLPIRSEFAKNSYIFPLRGVWYAGVEPPCIPDIDGPFQKSSASTSERPAEMAAVSKAMAPASKITSLLAVADGRVVSLANDEPEDAGAMQRPDETNEAYATRLRQGQSERLARGAVAVSGNFVMLDHGQNEFSMSAHLQPGSVRVKVGNQVKTGDVIGKLGSSGNSTEPHLHFQLSDTPDPLLSAGLPLNFTNVIIPWADAPRPIQSGDVVVAK